MRLRQASVLPSSEAAEPSPGIKIDKVAQSLKVTRGILFGSFYQVPFGTCFEQP